MKRRVIKGVEYALELCLCVAFMVMLYRAALAYGAIDFSYLNTDSGARMMTSFMALSLGFAGVPFLYLLLWVHRFLKWNAIKSAIRDFENKRMEETGSTSNFQ